MQETSGSRRRVPPRANPDDATQTQSTFTQQVAEVPWGVVILTTAVTTLAGYLTIEGIRALHGAVKRRRERKAEEDAPIVPVAAATNAAIYGARPDGSFSLPGPDEYDRLAAPGQQGFGRGLTYPPPPPHNPPPQHVSIDERLARIEQALLQSRRGEMH